LVKLPFPRKRDAQNDPLSPDVPVAARRSLPEHEQGLMFEATTHWGRGLAIVLGIIGTILVFLVLLTLLPKPGSGNPLESLANSFGSNTSAVTPVIGTAATPAVALATAPIKVASPGASGTGTPTPKFVAVPATGAPNVRSAANTNNNPIGNLAPNRQVEVIGRSPDNAWLQIIWDNNTKAWVAQELMHIIVGDASQIPVVR
jgi:hypothetical protein